MGKRRFVVAFLALCLVLTAGVASSALASKSAFGTNRDGPILVVGDSLVVQATKSLQSLNLPSVPIIAQGGLGSAPCDWETGYTDPLSGHHLKFSHVLQESHPAAVVFAFTGNPGLQSHSTGCVNSSGRYSLPTLLASYKRALTKMAIYAGERGAQVYLSATPPRNPAVAAGLYRGSGGILQYGFNGVPALNRLYQDMAGSELGQKLHWTYDRYPAEYVSTSSLTWRLNERCLPWDAGSCIRGFVQVRAGGLDAIHLDTKGAGAMLYAIGLVQLPLQQMRGWGLSSTLAVGLGAR